MPRARSLVPLLPLVLTLLLVVPIPGIAAAQEAPPTAPAQPAATQPAVSQPAVSQPTVSQPTVSQPAATQPEQVQPAPAEAIAPQPSSPQPSSPQPVLSQPVPLRIGPAPTAPPATDPAGTVPREPLPEGPAVTAPADTTRVPPQRPPMRSAADLTQGEAEALLATLEDPQQRELLARQLRLLVKAGRPQPPPDEGFGLRLLRLLSDRAEQVGAQVAATGRTLLDTPQAMRWLERQVRDPDRRNTWIRLLLELALIIGAGYAARLLTLWLLKRPRTLLGRKETPGPLTKIGLLLARTFMDLLPVAAFAAAGYGVLSATGAPQAVRLAALAFLNASIAVQLIMLSTRALLAPATPNLRMVPLADESAHYVTLWVRRIAVAAVYGYVLAQAALLLGMPARPQEGLLKLVGLVVMLMLVVLVLQNRHDVAVWLRGAKDRTGPKGAEPVKGSDPADAAFAQAVAGNTTPDEAAAVVSETPAAPVAATRGPNRAVAVLRRRLADVWHVLAIAYLVAIFGIWALEIEGGFTFMLEATAISVAALVVARLLSHGVDRLVQRAFAIAPELKVNFPGLEARANRYLPVLRQGLNGLIWTVALLTLLEGWGIEVLALVETPLGRRVTSSLVSIVMILLIALVVWEVVSAAIERFLDGEMRDGVKVERSPRMRTLLPLMQNAFLVLLVTLVALTVLSELGLDIAPLLAGAGVIGLAIGFGAQTLVKDVITGLFILIEDTISVGDVVDVGNGHSGVVEAINIRTVRLRDLAGTVHAVPFSAVTSVKNLTKDYSFYVFDIGVAYKEDVDRVIKVVDELGAELRRDRKYGVQILAPIEILGVDAFLDSAVVIKARIKTRPIQQWFVGREFNRRLKIRFDQLGIEIPFPQRTVHVSGTVAPADLKSAIAAAAAD